MKKSSTQALALALWLSCVPLAAGAQPVELAKDAPDKYVVVRGDTLWGISGKFLEKPWRWPEIWALNKDQISNPHLIYPGDIVYLDTSSGSPRLRLAKAVGGTEVAQAAEPSERVQPKVRAQALDKAPIPTINASVIEPFLTQPLVVDEAGLATHPYIVGAQEGRVYSSRGEIAFARNMPENAPAEWYIYRPARPIVDPDTRRVIAYEALHVGSARLEKAGDPATLRITSVREEVTAGDRLMPADPSRVTSFAPRPPEGAVNGRIVSVVRGVTQAGRGSVVAVSAGSANGLEIGNVLSITQQPRTVFDHVARQWVQLPGEPVGHLLVFRVFDKIAYGLVMTSSGPVSIGDGVGNP